MNRHTTHVITGLTSNSSRWIPPSLTAHNRNLNSPTIAANSSSPASTSASTPGTTVHLTRRGPVQVTSQAHQMSNEEHNQVIFRKVRG